MKIAIACVLLAGAACGAPFTLADGDAGVLAIAEDGGAGASRLDTGTGDDAGELAADAGGEVVPPPRDAAADVVDEPLLEDVAAIDAGPALCCQTGNDAYYTYTPITPTSPMGSFDGAECGRPGYPACVVGGRCSGAFAYDGVVVLCPDGGT